MTHLFLDGSSTTTLVGLIPGSYRILPSRAPSDGLLFKTLEELLEAHQLIFSNISSVAVGCGPGSHTGTRAVAAAAKGLSMGLKKPFKLFPSLLLSLPQAEGTIGTSLVTRGDLLYVLVYNTKTCQMDFNGLISAPELEILKLKLDHFGQEPSLYHLPSYLASIPPSSLNEPLTYLNFT